MQVAWNLFQTRSNCHVILKSIELNGYGSLENDNDSEDATEEQCIIIIRKLFVKTKHSE